MNHWRPKSILSSKILGPVFDDYVECRCGY
jgi:hypothetical protein